MLFWCILLYVSFPAITQNSIDSLKFIKATNESSTTTIQCPTWYHPAENNSKCVCGSELDAQIDCLEEDQVGVSVSSCISYTNEQVLIGYCPYGPPTKNIIDTYYYKVPQNVSDVNEVVCGSMNRTSLLCSQCQEGLSLAAMSYRRECVECSDPGRGIVLFIVLSTIPTTAFFLLVMMCSIDISTGHINAALVIVHVYLSKINQDPSSYILFIHSNSIWYYTILIVTTFFGIWNLDFLRYVIPPFCISRSLTSLQAEALEYVVAVYPLLLIVVTYICVEMYDKDYRIVVRLWAPFKKLFSNFCKEPNVKFSLLKAFATFLILSYTKIFNISSTLLVSIPVYNSTGDTVMTVPVIDASTSYLSAIHVHYVILAVVMTFIFNLLPLFLLLLYPMKCFHLLLGKFPSVNWHPLRAFMDIFQGCYKNGTDGTVDCRYFAAFNLLLRIIALFPINDDATSFTTRVCIVLIIFIALASLARPYQRNVLNYCEITIYSGLVIYVFWTIVPQYNCSLFFLYLLALAFAMYFCVVTVSKALKTISPRCYKACVERIKRFTEKTSFPCCCYQHGENRADIMERGEMTGAASHEVEEEFSNRDNNSRYHEPLLESSTHNTKLPTYGIIDLRHQT